MHFFGEWRAAHLGSRRDLLLRGTVDAIRLDTLSVHTRLYGHVGKVLIDLIHKVRLLVKIVDWLLLLRRLVGVNVIDSVLRVTPVTVIDAFREHLARVLVRSRQRVTID